MRLKLAGRTLNKTQTKKNSVTSCIVATVQRHWFIHQLKSARYNL